MQYFLWDVLAIIAIAFAYLMGKKKMQRRMENEIIKWQTSAMTDELTKIPNRRAWKFYTQKLCDQKQKSGFAVMVLDIDNCSLTLPIQAPILKGKFLLYLC